MKRKNATRNALFTSIIALLMCVSMLVGTTFAWFTDSVVSGNNVIAAGNLDIELLNNGTPVTSSTNLFDGVKWEPGVVDYENFTIKNEGNLALLYNFAMNWGDYNTLAGQYNLTQVLKVAMVDKHVSGDRAAAIAAGKAAGWKSLSDWSFSGEMTKKGDTKDFALIIYWEPSDNDNNWNMQNGKTLDKGDHLYVNLGINLQATQKMHESDSFGPDYDSLANAWDGTVGTLPAEENGVITLTTGAELAAFAAAVNGGNSFSGKTVMLGADINLGGKLWTPIGDCESGKYFQGTFDGQGHTIYNLSVDYSNDPSEHATAGLFGWVDHAMATVKNVNLENATVLGSHWVGGIAGYWTGTIENCSVRNSTIMGFNVNSEANGDKVGGIVGCLNEHSYINNNSVSGTEITANRDVGGIAGSVAATTYEMNNNTVTDTKICSSVEKDYASAGKIVSGRTGYVANDTNVATNVTITRVINVKTVAELNTALAALSGDALNTAAILQNCNEPTGVVQIPADYTGTLTLKDSSIASVQAENAADLVIAGTVKVVNAEGSAITGVELNISGNGNLTAIANGKAAFGIGGMNTKTITITNVTVDYVEGGEAYGVGTDTKYYKDAPEGGAAIGSGENGAIITLNNMTVTKAIGGSKAAAIGARYWTGVTVNITNSTIGYAEGGVTAAGIGSSRVSSDVAESGTTINITKSTVTAKGGAYGAGIGSGYDTHCASKQPLCTINIDGSTINATGGQYAAGVGTGYHNAALAGEIKNSTVNAVSGEKFYKDTYTEAQDIGFGVVDPAREGQQTDSKLIYNGTEIGIPGITVKDAGSLNEALSEGGSVVLGEKIQMEADKTAPYGNKYAVALNGGVLDGNNNELYMECYGDDYGIMTTGGTIKNLTIEEGCRAVMIMYPKTDIILDNVKIGGDGVLYPINTGEAGAEGVKLIVTNSVLAGWTSYSNIESAAFTNVEFKQGTYYNNIYGRVVKPYVNTTFTNCKFIEHMNLDLSGLEQGQKVTFIGCTVNGQAVTADVFTVPSNDDQYDTELFTVDLPSWATSIADCVVFG